MFKRHSTQNWASSSECPHSRHHATSQIKVPGQSLQAVNAASTSSEEISNPHLGQLDSAVGPSESHSNTYLLKCWGIVQRPINPRQQSSKRYHPQLLGLSFLTCKWGLQTTGKLSLHPAVKSQGFTIIVKGMRQTASRGSASAHSMTCRDSLALGKRVAADVCSVGDEHKLQGGIKMPCAEIYGRDVLGQAMRPEQSPLEQPKKENRAQLKNVVRAERSCWCLLFLCHTTVPGEKGNGSMYV